MSSLKIIRQRVGVVGSRFTSQQHGGKERDQQRNAVAPWREWHKTARWQALRRRVLQRDL